MFPTPVSLELELSKFIAGLAEAERLYTASKGRMEAAGVSPNVGTPAGDGVRAPLVMQPAKLQYNGGPHAGSPTMAGGGGSEPNGGPGSPASGRGVMPPMPKGWGNQSQWQQFMEKQGFSSAPIAPSSANYEMHNAVRNGLIAAPSNGQSARYTAPFMQASSKPTSGPAKFEVGGVYAPKYDWGSHFETGGPSAGGAANTSDQFRKQMMQHAAMVRNAIIATGMYMAVQTIGGVAGAYNSYQSETIGAGSDPFRRQLAQLHGAQDAVGSVPFVGGAAASIGTAIENFRFRHPTASRFGGVPGQVLDWANDPNKSQAALEMKEQNLQFTIGQSGYRSQTSMMRDSGSAAAMPISPFGARYNQIDAKRDFDLRQLRIDRYSALLGVTTQKQRDEIEANFGDREALIHGNAGYQTRGNSAELALNSAQLRAQNMQMDLTNQFRPYAGIAAGTQISATENFREQMREAALVANPDARSRVEDNAKLGMQGSILSLQGQEKDVLTNIYGGRPTEINAMQSVEAMRDISPETNQDALNALTSAIKDLQAALEKGGS